LKAATTGKETKSALMMPMITFVVAIVVVGLLIIFVLPSFGKLYKSIGAELPAMAKTLIGLGEGEGTSTIDRYSSAAAADSLIPTISPDETVSSNHSFGWNLVENFADSYACPVYYGWIVRKVKGT
jgi:hypothetical protein